MINIIMTHSYTCTFKQVNYSNKVIPILYNMIINVIQLYLTITTNYIT